MQADGSSNFAAHLADRFRVEREVGRGGWGLVYEAHDLRNDRRVAIKLLRSEFAGSVSGARFKREIEILDAVDRFFETLLSGKVPSAAQSVEDEINYAALPV